MTELELRYHVPKSQVWGGSRGAAHGNVHVHARDLLEIPAARGSRKLTRRPGRALCGKPAGWYERPPSFAEWEREPCPRCAELAGRLVDVAYHGLEGRPVPAEPELAARRRELAMRSASAAGMTADELRESMELRAIRPDWTADDLRAAFRGPASG